MDHRSVIVRAWQLTQENKGKFFLFGFSLGFITLTFEALWMIWQYYSFSHAPNLTGNEWRFGELFGYTKQIIVSLAPYIHWIFLGALFFVFLFFLVMPVFQGGIIVLIKRAHDGLEVRKRYGISEGILNFFKLFAFHNLVAFVFSPLSIFTYTTIPLKFISNEVFYFVLIPAILWLVVAIVANFLFVYTTLFLVLRQMHVGEAIRASARFVIRYFAETLVVFALLLIIALRVLFNIILVFVIPALITYALVFFIQFLIGYEAIIMSILAFIMLIVASWIYGNFLVFTQAVWELTFLELEKKDRVFEEEQTTV